MDQASHVMIGYASQYVAFPVRLYSIRVIQVMSHRAPPSGETVNQRNGVKECPRYPEAQPRINELHRIALAKEEKKN